MSVRRCCPSGLTLHTGQAAKRDDHVYHGNEAIILEPNGDELKVTLKADLAGSLSAARDSKRSPETGDLLGQIKLV